jgi:hypothetical protein
MTLANGGSGSTTGLASNYQLPSSVYSLGVNSATVNQATVTLSATRAYDGTNTFAASTFTVSTGITGQALTLSNSGAAANVGTGNINANASPYSFSTLGGLTLGNGTGGLASNYQLPVASTVNGTITPLALSLTISKSYNGTTSFNNLNTYNLDGMVGSESAPTITSGSATLSSANAGTYHSFASNSLVLSNPNYTLTGATITATINKALLTLSTSDVTKTYDGSLSTSGASVAPALIVTSGTLYTNASNGGTQDSVSGGSFAYADANAGTNTKTVTVTGATINDGNSGNNYNVSYVSNTHSTINKATATVSATKTYDGNQTLTSGQVIITGVTVGGNTELLSYTGTASLSDANYATANKYVNTSSMTLANGGSGSTTGLASNYQLPSSVYNLGVNSATVGKRSITITADAGQSKVYGDADPIFTYTPAPASGDTGLVVGDSFSGSLTRTVGQSVGSYTLKQGTLANSNYQITFISSEFAINKAILTVIPGVDQSKNYGQTDPRFTYAITGYINNDLVQDTSSNVVITGSLARASGESINSYAFNTGGMSSANYNIHLSPTASSFNILPAPIGIVLSGRYSGTSTISPTSFSVLGLAPGETITAISSAVVKFADVSSNGANYVTSVTGVTGSAIMSNYYITTAYNGNLNTTTTNIATITPAPLVITAANDARFVTQTDVQASANNCGVSACAGGYMGLTFNGFVNGQTKDVLSGTPSIIRTNSGVNSAGVYSGVLQPSGYASSNYNISYVSGDYIIAPANTLLVRVNPAITTYGSAPSYSATAAYLAKDGSTIVNLIPSISGSAVVIDDAVGGAARFNLGLTGATTSTSGNANVGGYNLNAMNAAITGSNFKDLMLVGSLTIRPYTLNTTDLGITTVSKVYDGNINIGGLVVNTDPTHSQVLGSGSNRDIVTILGSGIFTGNANIGTDKNVRISLGLSGQDGGNYILSNDSFNANIGTITQLASVNYVGPNGGLWSTQTNWAGGAIPTRDNVANVYIPNGTSVIYDVAKVTSLGALSKGGAGYAMTSNIINNGTVTINETSPTEIPNTLSGSGLFSLTSYGVVTISGNNNQVSPGAFTGQFSIGAGSTLILSNANALGTGSVISNGGNFGLDSRITLANLSISGPVRLASNIQTVGNQYYSGTLTTGFGGQPADTSMSISSQNGDITFNSGLNSDAANRSLTINASNGTVTFNDTVGYLSPNRSSKGFDIYNLIVNAKHINLFANVYTLNNQTYNGAVVIGDNGSNGLIREFISVDPSITFGGTVDDSSAVTHTMDVRAISYDRAITPSISFIGPIGSIVPLGALSVTTQTILPPPVDNPHADPVIESSGNLTIGGNVTTVGSQNFSTGGVVLQPSPGNSITLNSKQGTVQFVGLPQNVVADLGNQLTVLNNSAPVVPNIVQTTPSGQTTSNAAIVPILAPPELAFAIDPNPEGRVSVSEPVKTVPCDSTAKDECSKS